MFGGSRFSFGFISILDVLNSFAILFHWFGLCWDHILDNLKGCIMRNKITHFSVDGFELIERWEQDYDEHLNDAEKTIE